MRGSELTTQDAKCYGSSKKKRRGLLYVVSCHGQEVQARVPEARGASAWTAARAAASTGAGGRGGGGGQGKGCGTGRCQRAFFFFF
jgi:hypothetical protein